jgi:hypothetical protein
MEQEVEEWKSYAREVIARNVEKLLADVAEQRPQIEMGEEAVLTVKLGFSSDPNILHTAESRDEMGQYLDVTITRSHTESA